MITPSHRASCALRGRRLVDPAEHAYVQGLVVKLHVTGASGAPLASVMPVSNLTVYTRLRKRVTLGFSVATPVAAL
jgi:hypothetical protein